MTHNEKAEVVNILLVNYMRLPDDAKKWFLDKLELTEKKKKKNEK